MSDQQYQSELFKVAISVYCASPRTMVLLIGDDDQIWQNGAEMCSEQKKLVPTFSCAIDVMARKIGKK